MNAVAPGPVDTAMAKAVHSAAIRADYHDAIPLGRYGLDEELAEAISSCVPTAPSYITGQTLAVDGGFDAIGIGLPTFRKDSGASIQGGQGHCHGPPLQKILPRHVAGLGLTRAAMRAGHTMRAPRMLRLAAVRLAVAVRRPRCILVAAGIRHRTLVDAEHAFDAADHAADGRADHGADRTGDPVAFMKSVRGAAGPPCACAAAGSASIATSTPVHTEARVIIYPSVR